MAKSHHPRRGSMQFWPRKRSKRAVARVRSWTDEKTAKPLGFIGYKAGMTYVMATDNRPKSNTKGETVTLPVTIVECPPMTVFGVSFYTKSLSGVRKSASVFADKFDKHLGRAISVPKKASKSLDSVTEFDDVRLLVHTNTTSLAVGRKKPHVIEIAVGGSKDDKLALAKELLGKTVSLQDVFEAGATIDVHGITKGKGFQGTVKRFGVPIKQHKGEKIKRGIGNLGAWTPKRVDYRVPQGGKMGFHLRTDYNKQILKIGDDGAEVTRKGGITKYGEVKNTYLLLHGSVPGPRKRAIVMTAALRPNNIKPKDAFSVNYIA